MFRLISAIGLVAAASVFCSTGALAITAEVVQPEVSVNRGDGYIPLTAPTTVSPGHLVMAAPNGSGRIVYNDGCVVEVQPGAVVAVYETSPCQAQTGDVNNSAQEGAANTGSRRGYIIAGVVVAAIAGGAIALSASGDGDDDGVKTALIDDDDDEGSSP